MAFEIPIDEIKKVQVLARNECRLSTYDLHDQSVPPMPSFDTSISELDAIRPENPRCQKCNAKLLRGRHSLICIYCGAKIQIQDNLPDPISYNSTFACQWLLHSLSLDQSESIELCNENSELNRGQRTTKQEICLNDLLHFEITLSNESEKTKSIVTNKVLGQSNSSLNLSGAYLGNIISKSPSIIYTSVSEDQPVIIGSSQVVSKSGNDSSPLSGQEAEFQSSSKHRGSIADLSFDVDSVVGPDDSIENDSEDDLQNNVDSKVSQQDENDDDSDHEAKDGSSLG